MCCKKMQNTPRMRVEDNSASLTVPRTAAPVLPSPAPSAEPSPLLSNNDTLQQSTGNHYPAADPARVSNMIDLTSPSTQVPQPQSEEQSLPSPLVSLPPEAPANHPLPPLQTQGRQSPSGMWVPPARNAPSQHGHRPNSQALQLSNTIEAGESPFRSQYQNQNQWPGSPNVLEQPTGLAIDISRSNSNPGQTQIHGHESRDQHPSPAQINLDSPNTRDSPYSPIVVPVHGQSQPGGDRTSFPSSALAQDHVPQHVTGEAVVPSDIAPRPHRRTHPPIMPPLKPKIKMIQDHIRAAGGTQNLNNGLERPRFQLLTDACDTQDIFYVVMHQLFCAWDYDQPLILNIGGLPDRNILVTAFSILGQLIRHNEGMAPNHLRWFTAFPNTINRLWATSEAYRQVIGDVGVFLYKLASQWGTLSRHCLSRQYPPLVDELVNGLGILSPILQGVVFTATRRNLGLADNQFGQEAEKIFAQDKRGYEELSAAYKNAVLPSSAMVLRNQELANSYIALGRQAHVVRHTLDNIPRPHPSSSNAAARHFSALPSSSMDQVTRNTIPQSQEYRNNQNTQPITTTTTGSSAPRSTIGPSFVASPVSQLLVTPSQLQQGPTLMSNGPRLNQNHPAYLGTFQGATTSSASRSEEPVNRARSPRTVELQQQHIIRMRQHEGFAAPRSEEPVDLSRSPQVTELQRQQLTRMQQRQALTFNQGQGQTTAVPSTQPRQLLFPSQMQTMAQQRPHHQATGANQPPQLSSSSLVQPTSQLQNNRGGRSASSSSAPSLQPQASVVHSFLPSPATMKHQVQAYNDIQPPIMRPLVPPLGYIHPADPQNPALTALHQAHVRSPVLFRAPDIYRDKTPGDVSQKFYQSVKGFALEPSKIAPSANISKFEFTINEQDLSLMAKDACNTASTRPVLSRQFGQGALQYRLRCVRASQSIASCSNAEWMAGDTAWPEIIFILVNDEVMEIRRKSHHLKDLPIDITSYILPVIPGHGSTNKIRMSTPRSSKSKDQSTYFVAVEVVEILGHSQIIDLCNQQRIPASQTLDAIKKSLAGPAIDDDDDISMVVSDLSVELADPFTARIFDTPVRGDSCLHRECFDLEPFLLTRKANGANQPSMVDVWKCPVCGGDARPYTLRVDDFFTAIRAKLASDGNLDIKAIWISADGSWRPKSEEALKRKASPMFYSDDEDEGPAVKQRILKGAATSRTSSTDAGQVPGSASRPVEIIELDDDD